MQTANSLKRGATVFEIPAEAYAGPMTTDYRKNKYKIVQL